MTIVAAVKVRDGLILGTDSMTQISVPTPEGPQFLKSYSNARKLFQIGSSIGVMTYGLGNIGDRSIEGLLHDFGSETAPTTVEQQAARLFEHVREPYDREFASVAPDQRPALGFYIAGYSEAAPFPEEFEFLLPRDDAPVAARPEGVFGASWRGVDGPFTRLYKGFDPYVIPSRLAERGVDDVGVRQVLDPQGLETAVVFDGMPVQDAINFTVYILETTIGWATFAVGVPSCGGPLQVATIQHQSGFEWIANPAPRVEQRP